MSNPAASPPVSALIILDGWGHNPKAEHNAIAAAKCPVWDELWSSRPRSLLDASGPAVGLPAGQMGNSEVGHLTMGAGRPLPQSLSQIDQALASGDFAKNPAYRAAVERALQGGALHIMGLLSPGGVHSHERHIRAMVQMAADAGVRRICCHAFLDGRDTAPRSARPSLESLQAQLAGCGGRLASICGRYYAMDRDQRWERTAAAWQMLAQGRGQHRADCPLAALDAAYQRGQSDEFVEPTIIGEPLAIADGDALVFMNFRADRARQLSQALTAEHFDGFDRPSRPRPGCFVTSCKYADDIASTVAFNPPDASNSLGEVLAAHGRTQLRLAETEKYAHVTYFFSGGREAPFDGEERILIPSPRVATYDLAPDMGAPAITDALVDSIRGRKHQAIVCNYANGDMVGHTGIFEAAVQAVECLDGCLGRIIGALDEVGGQCLITADHGNVEDMHDPHSGQALTSHTSHPVPLVYGGRRELQLAAEGTLADIAPTMLHLMGLASPKEMTGNNLCAPS